jgi:putative colanic acid biosynthesis acetyltransferase WcaF
MILEDNDPFIGPSFSLANRFRRTLWNIVHALLFKTSPRPFHAWRASLLRLFGASIGRDCHVYPLVKIWAPWNLCLGDFVGIADGVTLYCMDKISIGNYAVVSQGAHLCCGSHDYNSHNFQLIAKPIVIHERVWVCAEVFIHPGVVVPEGAVIGARAVVTKSLFEPWSVYAGNPCKQVATRIHTKLNQGDIDDKRS